MKKNQWIGTLVIISMISMLSGCSSDTKTNFNKNWNRITNGITKDMSRWFGSSTKTTDQTTDLVDTSPKNMIAFLETSDGMNMEVDTSGFTSDEKDTYEIIKQYISKAADTKREIRDNDGSAFWYPNKQARLYFHQYRIGKIIHLGNQTIKKVIMIQHSTETNPAQIKFEIYVDYDQPFLSEQYYLITLQSFNHIWYIVHQKTLTKKEYTDRGGFHE